MQQADESALRIALEVHRLAEASQTFLFGSRARGDHQPGSDIDIMVIREQEPGEEWPEGLRAQARELQKKILPEASGVDVMCMTRGEFFRTLQDATDAAATCHSHWKQDAQHRCRERKIQDPGPGA